MVFFMHPPIKNERRETPRIKCQNAVEYRILNPDQFQNDFMHDISEKGLSFLIKQQMPNGVPVAFQTKLTKNSPAIFGKGKIVWSSQESLTKKYRIGVEIIEWSKDSISRISEFLETNKDENEQLS